MTKKEVFASLRQLEVKESGPVVDDVIEQARIDSFKEGYLMCLNEVKKAILSLTD